jgi:hypothetical protein
MEKDWILLGRILRRIDGSEEPDSIAHGDHVLGLNVVRPNVIGLLPLESGALAEEQKNPKADKDLGISFQACLPFMLF